MKLTFGLVIAAMTLPTAANAAALQDAIRADMPQLMTLYRDLHANPELSMQEVRTPAKLADCAGEIENLVRKGEHNHGRLLGVRRLVGALVPSRVCISEVGPKR